MHPAVKENTCFRKMTPTTVDKFKMIRRKGVEYYGFIDGKGDLIDTRPGHPTSVAAEIIPKSDCEWHYHPLPVPSVAKIGGLSQEDGKQLKCAIEAEKIRTSIVSEADASIAFLRPWTVPVNGENNARTTSMVATHEGFIEYYLANPKKWSAFREWVDAEYGRSNEVDLQMALGIEGNKIFNKAMEEVYEKRQDFSFCGDRDIWGMVRDRWHALLQERTGMAISKPWAPAGWKPPEPTKEALGMVGKLLKGLSDVVGLTVVVPKGSKVSVFDR